MVQINLREAYPFHVNFKILILFRWLTEIGQNHLGRYKFPGLPTYFIHNYYNLLVPNKLILNGRNK